MAEAHRKNQKLRAYYATKTGVKPNFVYARHFIHSQESNGLWASVRDLSARESLTNDSTEEQHVKIITIGYNEKVLSLYKTLIFENDYGVKYRAKAAPDAYFEDCKSDLRITAYVINDTNNYAGEDVYE